MPQLNPSPWLFILIISWTIFLLFSPTKISNHLFLNEPSSKLASLTNNSWSWPWP